MENKGDYFDGLKDDLLEYGKTRLDLAKVEAGEKTARLTAYVFSFLLLCFILFLSLVFIGIAAGYYFSSLTGSYSIGFGIVAAINLLLLLFIWAFRKSLIEIPVINKVIGLLFR